MCRNAPLFGNQCCSSDDVSEIRRAGRSVTYDDFSASSQHGSSARSQDRDSVLQRVSGCFECFPLLTAFQARAVQMQPAEITDVCNFVSCQRLLSSAVAQMVYQRWLTRKQEQASTEKRRVCSNCEMIQIYVLNCCTRPHAQPRLLKKFGERK